MLHRLCGSPSIPLENTATVEVLDTTSKWFGVTYAADRESTVARIQQLVDEGVYPNKLF